MNSKLKSALVVLAVLISGCAAKFEQKIDFNPVEPLRVAVLPFAFVNDKGQIVMGDDKLAIDKVELVSSELSDSPETYVYKLALTELAKTGLDVMPPVAVESKLLHNGFGHEDLSFDEPRIFAASATELCSKLFSCDAILLGKVTKWDRSYYAIQSTSTVGIELQMLSGRTGQVLFSSQAEDSDSRGLTKGPTGFSDLVLEPIRGLDNKIIADLARRTMAKMLDPLKLQNRPEFLNTAPPAIYASAHDTPNGIIRPDGSLKVLAFGSPDMTASFSIGDAVQHIPMIQKDDGHYIGEFFPLPSDTFQEQEVDVFLTDSYGRTAQQKIGSVAVSLSR